MYLIDRSRASTFHFLVILCGAPSYGVGQENEIATQAGVPAIHRAWSWSEQSSQHQKSRLWEHQSRKGLRKRIRELISQQQRTTSRAPVTPRELNLLLLAVRSDKLGPVSITSVAVPGRAIFVTEELLRSLEPQKELALICATSIP